MTYLQVQFDIKSTEQREILLALLADAGFDGFEESDTALKAFISETTFDKTATDTIASNNNITYSISSIKQQNWNAQWESSFEPVIINDFAAIRAGFHQPVKNVQYEIIITPKMSFGTGHHATTFLVIQQMSKLNFVDKSVLDFGTGTGVLAILAEKMGANSVKAIDNDDWSIENAKENIGTNDVNHITVEKAESIDTTSKFDIILANINLNVILQNMPDIAAVSKPGAQILLSGFLYSDEAAIKQSLNVNGLIFNSLTQQKDWICIWASKP